ncbi:MULTISPECIES: hypothetical protein [Bacillales]|uniref:CopG family transcriptional regulator n=1 Tax=Brevibacillus aydinogluensis TaxID=927786 RepID=A0AA48M7B9_9BACL|nr:MULTISPECIES: hypothetical protein [Bacillales]MBR8659626.1 hypothetical protein [Brevibacillus sp. NL20B1]MDT3415660.1 hypothetical protein [Brevibacillus aydinogluensis]UFJ60688.1 hypothetical protein IRT44_15680 [Anoxybacillus sediminis]CAJ1002589.1 CopG family transcriptional regulator [Brevibacillus aydinogluensis]
MSDQQVQILDFEELLRYIERRLAESGKYVQRDAIIAILQAEEAFLMEKGVLQEVKE